jgi:hypothetical protein
VTLGINDTHTRHSESPNYHHAECRDLFTVILIIIMPSVIMLSHNAECHYAECHFVESHNAEYHGAQAHIPSETPP